MTDRNATFNLAASTVFGQASELARTRILDAQPGIGCACCWAGAHLLQPIIQPSLPGLLLGGGMPGTPLRCVPG